MSQLPLFHHDPDGLLIRRRFIDQSGQADLVRQIDQMPWDDRMNRRVQQYGFEYCYTDGGVSQKVTDIPQHLVALSLAMRAAGLIRTRPNAVIVNEYLPGQGIFNHVDSGLYDEEISIVSLLSPVWFDMISPQGVKRPIDIHPGDALVMRGAARYNYSHGIAERLTDDGRPRRRRISVAFRNVTVNPVTVDVK